MQRLFERGASTLRGYDQPLGTAVPRQRQPRMVPYEPRDGRGRASVYFLPVLVRHAVPATPVEDPIRPRARRHSPLAASLLPYLTIYQLLAISYYIPEAICLLVSETSSRQSNEIIQREIEMCRGASKTDRKRSIPIK